MSNNCFVDLLVVKAGDQIKFAQFAHDIVREHDVVELETGEIGVVLYINYTSPNCYDYECIAAYASVHSVKNHYRRTTLREESEDAPV